MNMKKDIHGTAVFIQHVCGSIYPRLNLYIVDVRALLHRRAKLPLEPAEWGTLPELSPELHELAQEVICRVFCFSSFADRSQT
jgi:hypothetical protein